MSKLIENSKFVKPYFISELGSEGLRTKDIAKSLGTQKKYVMQKLKKRAFLDRILRQGWLAVTIEDANDTNGIPYEDVALDVNAAKFFVAKYDNDIGDSYLNFLIKCEDAIENLDPEDVLLRQTQMLVDHKNRIKAAEKDIRVLKQEQQTIKKRQDAARDNWLDYPVPVKKLPPKSFRSLINDMIRSYCKIHELDDGYSIIYKKVYANFKALYNIDLQTRARNESTKTGKKISALEYADREGLIEDLYAVAYEYCSPSRSEEKGDNLELLESYNG